MKVVILRGIPGAGKSTKAKKLIEQNNNCGTICSADDFFIINGHYKFDVNKLGVNHGKCFTKFQQALQNKDSLVILDNTNIKRKDFAHYVTAAKNAGYEVEEIVVGSFDDEFIKLCDQRNVHGVPVRNIERMARTFQE